MARETDIKTDRLARLAREHDVGGVLIVTQRNFAWLTGGATNRIDGSREPGAGTLFVSADGRRFVLANAIEMPRLAGEALRGCSFEPVEYRMDRGSRQPGHYRDLAGLLARRARPTARRDWPLPQAAHVEPAIMRARVPLVDEEIDRYRALGRDIGVRRRRGVPNAPPGIREQQIADAAGAAISRARRPSDRRPVAGDERLARYRHPVPTGARLAGLGDGGRLRRASRRDRRALAHCRRGNSDGAFSARMRATAAVFAQLVERDAARHDGRRALRGRGRAHTRRPDIPAKSGDIIRAARSATARASGSRTRGRRRSSRGDRRSRGIQASRGRRSKTRCWSSTAAWSS